MERKKKFAIVLVWLEKRYSSGEDSTIAGKKWDPFLTLISCVLSQRSRDANTMKASEALFAVASTPQAIAALPLSRLEQLIRPSGPYRQKAARIKEISRAIAAGGGRVPKTREELMAFHGVGPKTADITLSYGHGIPSIAIDTHCNRIPKRLGIICESASLEEVKHTLEALTPVEKWNVVNRGLVRFGQEVCLPRGPRCAGCPFNSFCLFYKNLHVNSLQLK